MFITGAYYVKTNNYSDNPEQWSKHRQAKKIYDYKKQPRNTVKSERQETGLRNIH